MEAAGAMGLSSSFKRTMSGGIQVISFTTQQQQQQQRFCFIVIAARQSFENRIMGWRFHPGVNLFNGFRIPRYSGEDEEDRIIYSDEQNSLRRPVRRDGSSESVEEIRRLIGGEIYEEDVEAQIVDQVLKIKQHTVKGALEVAYNAIQQLFSRFPNHSRVLLEYAHIEAKRGNHAAAVSLFSRAIEILEATRQLNYDYVLALQGWGSSEARVKNHSRAKLLFQESILAAEKLDSSNEGHSQRAIVYGLHAWALLEDKLGNWSTARDLLQRAATIQPKNAVVHHARALMEARAHNYAAARFSFRLAILADPNDAKSWQAWALFEAGQQKYGHMRRLFYRAYFANKNDLYTLQAWAHQEALIGTTQSKERARKLFQRCVEVSPENPYSWQSWALLEEKCGNYQGARILYEHGLRVNPSNVPCLQAFAKLERSQGNVESARNLLRYAREIDPLNAPSLMESAMLEKDLGNHNVAMALFDRARRLDKEKSRLKRLKFISRKTNRVDKQRPTPEVARIVKEAIHQVVLTQRQLNSAVVF